MYVLCGRCYEEGSTGSMAEEGSVYDLEGLEKQLHSLLSRYTSDELRADGKPFCSDFCKLVEEYASRWQVPLPQLRILEIALCYFAQTSTFFTSNCDHVLRTLSSLALSVFELLLFFDQKDLLQEPLKHFTNTFQECHLALARHQNVHLLQVDRLVRGGGPWASPALQAILSGANLPQSEVDGCISSELPVFFELRVRYLLSCERVNEAMALAKCCAWHPTAGQHSFFLQVYLTWLFKTSQHESLHKEVANFNGKDAIHVICSLEYEEKDELLLALSRAFLSQQLCRGDIYNLCDLVFVWSKLHHRLKTSKQALLEETHQLMLSATNVNSIFPFIRAILQEVGEDGIQFCVELCANALKSCLPCDVVTKSLIYKTIAGLLPNDLEVCRACALLVFFLERTVEAYKIVYLLYMHPDQEYHVEHSPIRNHVRFETLQVLKKDLYFDPEFWNLIALRTNCLKLMSEKVVSSALEEIMEDNWILNYCTKEPALRGVSVCQTGNKTSLQAAAKKRHHKEDRQHNDNGYAASKRLKVGQDKPPLNVDHIVKRKGNHGSRPLKDAPCQPLRRSFWQLDRLQGNGLRGESRRTTRLSEKNPPKRRIRTPKWLLEDSGTLEENNAPPKIKRHGFKNRKHHQSTVEKRSETGQIKNNAKHKPSVNSHLMERENSKHHKGFSVDCQPAAPPQVILELSLPDNELMGSFMEETCNRQRGFPQVLLYKPTVKLPATSQPVKPVNGKEVILRARDMSMFLQQLHCYARRKKGKGNRSNVQGSVSTITRSSVQGSPPKGPHTELCENIKGGFASQTPAAVEVTDSPVLEKAQTSKPGSRKTSSARELSEKSAVEMKCTVASQSPDTAQATESRVLDEVPQAQSTGEVSQTKKTELPVKSAVEMNVIDALQMSAATDVTEPPVLVKVLQAQTREVCEESSVEMKVTIASQTPTAGKVTQSPGLDEVYRAPSVKDASEITTSAEASQISTADNNQIVGTEEIPSMSDIANISTCGAADPIPSHFQDIIRDGKSLSCQAKTGSPDVLTNSISEVDISPKLSEGHAFSQNGTSPGTTIISAYTPTDPDNVSDISALTLVTEIVAELAPEKQAPETPVPEDGGYKESKAGSKPKVCKLQTTSSCSVPELGASAVADEQEEKGETDDTASETLENGEQIESEESKLEYCCTFCNKVFKGSRVVAHAMFHYRRDECMFCGTMFKDDLLAMMHLSDHIEKLKRIKESDGNKPQENGVPETKDISTPTTSANDVSFGHRRRGRPRKSAICPKSVSLSDSTPSVSRKLRSNDKPLVGPSLQGKKQNSTKHLKTKIPVHKVNGHMGRKKVLDRWKADTSNSEVKQPHTQQELSQKGTSDGAENPRLQESQDMERDSASSVQIEEDFSSPDDKMKETESLQVLKTATKQGGEFVEEKNMKPQEKVCCPVDGCAWFTYLSKNRVALLYHALQDHYGEVRPLELAFRIGKSRCSICMRVLWSFEHFQHHVERHRLTPRHPCLHQGCTARFKTGIEMRRHTRRHSPLQAACCLPGCSQLFICLWALNLHEREHYASKTTKPDKNTNKHTGDKHINRPAEKKPLDHEQKDETATATGNKTLSVKATRKSRGQATHNAGKHRKALSSATVKACLLKRSNESKDTHVLKNLSNKDTSAQPTGPTRRLRQTLRKTNTSLAALKSLKVISTSLLKHNNKVRYKFKKKHVNAHMKCPKRRGRPPKSKTVVPDENTATSQHKETVKVKMDQRRAVELASPSKAAETSDVSKKCKDIEKSQQGQDEVKTTETSTDESESKKPMKKRIKKSHVKEKGVSNNAKHPIVTAQSLNQSITTSADKTQKSTAVKMKKLHKAEKCSGSKENGCQTASSASESSKQKKQKDTNDKASTLKEPESALKRPATSNSVVPQVDAKAPAAAPALQNSADDEGKAKAENTDSTQTCSGNAGLAVPANSLNEITSPLTTSGENSQKVTTEEKSKKSHDTIKEGKKEKKSTSESSKKKMKHKDTNKTGDKKRKRKEKERKDEQTKTSDLTKTVNLKSVDQQVEAKAAAAAVESPPDEEGKAKEASPPTPDSSLNEMTSKPAVTSENTQKAAKKEKSKKHPVVKNPDPNKTNKKRRVVHEEGGAKAVKKKCKDQTLKKPAKAKNEVRAEVVESSVDVEEKASMKTPQSKTHHRLYAKKMNGQATAEDSKSTVCKATLAAYGKKPYMRPPPTAYLDEKYITMPKRRKEMSSFQSPQSPEQEEVRAALKRQRCANCFATFNSVEHLHSHLQLKKCSNLFGFDSDDEGNSSSRPIQTK